MISQAPSFKKEQQNLERVKEAYITTFESLKNLFNSKGVKLEQCNLFIRAFKNEKKLEVFAKNSNDITYKLIKTYDFCVLSGALGPKRKQGDYQVPEGVYFIDRYNAWSTFHLSLGLNYPNEYDKVKAINNNPGGDIFIHGNCVSVGCIPITDVFIKELYVMCLEANNAGQKQIPVHIFPYKMNKINQLILFDSKCAEFWKILEPIYDFFENKRQVPDVKVTSKGYVMH